MHCIDERFDGIVWMRSSMIYHDYIRMMRWIRINVIVKLETIGLKSILKCHNDFWKNRLLLVYIRQKNGMDLIRWTGLDGWLVIFDPFIVVIIDMNDLQMIYQCELIVPSSWWNHYMENRRYSTNLEYIIPSLPITVILEFYRMKLMIHGMEFTQGREWSESLDWFLWRNT